MDVVDVVSNQKNPRRIIMLRVSDIRKEFCELLAANKFVTDKSGCKLIEMIGVQFIADEGTIFGPINHEYVKREIEWYDSMSRNVRDIPGGPPTIWEQVASRDGIINSNYGWCIYSAENHYQFDCCLNALLADPLTRRAILIYTRPSMQLDYCRDGMSDFMCTNTVQYFIRNNSLHTLVNMRSNDAWAGYRNDYSWQVEIRNRLLNEFNRKSKLKILPGNIIWNVGSLHIYSRQFYLVDYFSKTGNSNISKNDYCKLNPKSIYCNA